VTKAHFAGETIAIEIPFRDPVTNNAVEVSGVTARWAAPDGTLYDFIQSDMTSPEPGRFVLVFNLPDDKPGLWQFRATCAAPFRGVTQLAITVVAKNVP
jgi:hypothetical protein